MKLICPNCNKETEHRILSMRSMKNGIEYTLKCSNCGYVYKKYVEEEKMKEVKVIWSWRDKSEVKKILKLEEDILAVGDEISINNINEQCCLIGNAKGNNSRASGTAS